HQQGDSMDFQASYDHVSFSFVWGHNCNTSFMATTSPGQDKKCRRQGAFKTRCNTNLVGKFPGHSRGRGTAASRDLADCTFDRSLAAINHPASALPDFSYARPIYPHRSLYC